MSKCVKKSMQYRIARYFEKPKAIINNVKFSITIFLSFFLFESSSAQCLGAAVSNGNQSNPSSAVSCNNAFSGASQKYKSQLTFVPNNLDPVITVKVVVHVFMPTVPLKPIWNSGTNPYNGLTALQNCLSGIQGQMDRFSSARVATYPSTSTYIYDSKLQFEVVAYYFYPSSDAIFYGTTDGLPLNSPFLDPPANTIPNPNYNGTANGAPLDALNYIEQTYPNRLKEGIPVLLLDRGQAMGKYSSLILGTSLPYLFIGHEAPNDPSTVTPKSNATRRVLIHELGHCMGLLHPYYGGEWYESNPVPPAVAGPRCGYPGTGSPTPETFDATTKQLDCGHDDYLSDLFPSNNPFAANMTYPNPVKCPNPLLNNCGSVYENDDLNYSGNEVSTNNMMSDNSLNSQNVWITPLQMGRRIRSMHLKNNGLWTGVADWGDVRMYAKDAVSGHASTWDIYNDETWYFDIQMYKDIVVKSGKTLTIKCVVKMATDGKIIVEKGARLIIDDGRVTSWCKKTPVGSNTNYPLWSGIEVAGDPTQNQIINSNGLCQNQGIVELKNNAVISYAQKGIITSLTSPTGVWQNNTSGGIVIANGANFTNNVYDIIFYKYQLPNTSSKVVNCNFKTTGLIGSYGNANTQITPKEHLKLYQNWGLNVQGCTFECVPGIYAQANNGAGIYATDSYFSVDQYCATSGCANGVRTKFANLNVGAWIDNFNPLYSGQIQNCDFNDNVKGVLVENSDYLLFQNNTVNMTGSYANTYTGMYFYKSKYYTVKNNNINGTGKQGGGIIAYDSQNGAHQVYRNTFVGLNTAILAVDNNGGYSSGTSGLKMNCNVFNSKSNNNNMYDIALTPSLAVMPVVMSDQSALPNQVFGGGDLVRNIYGATPNFSNWWAKTKFYVDGSNTQQINHASTPSGADNPNVGTILASPQVIVSPVNVSFNYSQHCLANPPSSGGDVGFNPQRVANMNSYLTSLRSNNVNNQNAFEIQATVASKLNVFLTDTLPHSQDSVLTILNSNQGGMDDADVQLIFAYIRKANYTMASSKINALPLTRANWKALLAKIVEIEQEPNGIYSLLTNNSNVAFLTDYATTEGKDGQACAQAMLRFVFDTEHQYPATFPPLVEEGSSRMANLSNSTGDDNGLINDSSISVYPNPAQAAITVVNTGTEEENLKLEVKDLLGKVIYTNFIARNTKLYISLTEWNNGMYLLDLTKSNKEVVYRSKLIKQN